MGTAMIVLVIVLAAWNAVRTMGKQKKRMKGQTCAGDCSTCKTPCEAKRICGLDEDIKREK